MVADLQQVRAQRRAPSDQRFLDRDADIGHEERDEPVDLDAQHERRVVATGPGPIGRERSGRPEHLDVEPAARSGAVAFGEPANGHVPCRGAAGECSQRGLLAPERGQPQLAHAALLQQPVRAAAMIEVTVRHGEHVDPPRTEGQRGALDPSADRGARAPAPRVDHQRRGPGLDQRRIALPHVQEDEPRPPGPRAPGGRRQRPRRQSHHHAPHQDRRARPRPTQQHQDDQGEHRQRETMQHAVARRGGRPDRRPPGQAPVTRGRGERDGRLLHPRRRGQRRARHRGPPEPARDRREDGTREDGDTEPGNGDEIDRGTPGRFGDGLGR